jgi:hypothetical protein
VQVVTKEEHLQGVQSPGPERADDNTGAQRHQDAAGREEPKSGPELGAEAWPWRWLVVRGRGAERPDGGEGDHEGKRVYDQRPLHAQREEQGRCERWPDDGGGAGRGLQHAAGVRPVDRRHDETEHGQARRVEELREGTFGRDYRVNGAEFRGERKPVAERGHHQ